MDVEDSQTSTETDSSINKAELDDDLAPQAIRQLELILTKKCKKCITIKAPQSHHCSICKRCIARMDHHCPWVNNCVGYYNQKFFLLFLIYVFLGSSHALYKVGMKISFCLNINCALFRDFHTQIMTGIAMFMALLFCLFVIVMFCDQISCIVENTSSKYQLLMIVFCSD